MRPWRARPTDEGLVARLAGELGLRKLTARVLVARGLDSPTVVGRFLLPRLGDLRPPEGIADLDRALARLAQAAVTAERVGVFGDYDVDGVTTAAVLTQALRALGCDVVPRMARRASGYGLSPEDAQAFVDAGCRVVVTGDCGTSDHQALALCRAAAVDTIVIDHHQVPSGPSAAYALINPHRPDDRFPFKGLASCGVAFYIAAALRTRLRAAGHAGAERFDPRGLLDLVALGTVADMVPLVDENRILVTAGLRELAAFRRPGLRALAIIAELQPGQPLTSTDVSFRLTPRLNAAGRLGDARLALDLLLAEDPDEGRRLAERLDEVNKERQRVQEAVWVEAAAQAQERTDDAALVLGAEGWHHGVVGIVAAKLMERHRKPVIVVGFKDGQGRGSARTVGGFNLYEALRLCEPHLLAYGGHAAAAGMSLSAAALPAFRAAFNQAAGSHFQGLPDDLIEVDAVAALGELDIGQAEELGRLAPFGSANAEPLLAVPGVTARFTRVVGTDHLQLVLASGTAEGEAIAFGMAQQDPGGGAALDVIGMAEVDSFRGYRRARLRLKHLLRKEL